MGEQDRRRRRTAERDAEEVAVAAAAAATRGVEVEREISNRIKRCGRGQLG